MLADIDRMDADAWASRLAPDAVMRFGNADPVYGRERCRDALAAFRARIDERDLICDYRVYIDLAPVLA